MELKRGQKVWVWHKKGEPKETTIKSVGPKYIRAECDDRVKYDRETLREINGCGYARYIILDLEEHKKDVYYREIKAKLRRFDWSKLDRNKIDKIVEILELKEQ